MRNSAISFLLQATPWVPLEVRRGSVADISVHTPTDATTSDMEDPSECLVWQFALEEFDIGFQLLENGEATQEMVRYRANARDGAPTIGESEPIADHNYFEGQWEDVQLDAVYTLRWDNSYSLVRHKCLWYRYLVTSSRALEAAHMAVKDLEAKHHEKKGNARPRLPHVARKQLMLEESLNAEQTAVAHATAIAQLERSVVDVVSLFMTNPDSPLHEGSIRSFILTLETVFRNGIKESYWDAWPEEPYYEFLLETATVLRDDQGLVAEVKMLQPPPNLQFLGWTRARALLLLALNKSILHRAFENLCKRRVLVEQFYKPTAILFSYENASKIASFLSALNAVKTLLVPFPSEEHERDDGEMFPVNLSQHSPEADFSGESIIFQNKFAAIGNGWICRGYGGDPEDVKDLEHCTLPRYILHEQPVNEAYIGRADMKLWPLKVNNFPFVLALQMKVQTQDILVSLTNDDNEDITVPIRVPASDMWIEIIFRITLNPTARQILLKLDNSYSLMRSKQVLLRYATIEMDNYTQAWESCLELAQVISWKNATSSGSVRCAEYLTTLQLQDEQEATVQRIRIHSEDKAQTDGEDGNDDKILGISTSLIAKPVSYLVGGLLFPEGDTYGSCAQCLIPFSFFSRQYLCPACQSVVCIPCSRHYVQVGGRGSQLKTCDRCFIKEKDQERQRKAWMGNQEFNGECAEYTALKADPEMSKYFKMLGFGVPPSGVAQKMVQDDVAPDKIAVFVAGPQGSNGNVSPTSSSRRGSYGDRPRLRSRSGSTFRKVHWTNLESKKANESIWTRVTARRKVAPIALSPQDFHELERLFGAPSGLSALKKGKSSTAKKNKFSALDSRRANNISIGLSQFKSFGGSEAIINSLNSCDLDFLTSDRLSNLLEIAPTSVEVKRYTDFKGSQTRLEAAEKFLVDMCKIPRVTEKITVMLFATQFDHQQHELSNRIQLITRACYEVLQSERLARCFELVLTIGNHLNAGTELGDAHGVTLASLLKLSETKAIDCSVTLLQFIIKLIYDRGEGDILYFVNELSTLADAKRLSNVILTTQVKELQRGIAQMENEIKEELVNDLKRHNKEEARRKRQFEEQLQGHVHQPPLQTNAMTENGDVDHPPSRTSRGLLLESIRQRNNGELRNMQVQVNGTSTNESEGTRVALLTPIEKKGAAISDETDTESTTIQSKDSELVLQNGRSALLAAIKQRKMGGASDEKPRNVRFHTACSMEIRTTASSSININKPDTLNEKREDSTQISTPTDPRSALLASIKRRQHTSDRLLDEHAGGNAPSHRSALLASIKQHARTGSTNEGNSTAPDDHVHVITRSIQADECQTKLNFTSNKSNGDAGEKSLLPKFVPRQYVMSSKFVTIMRERLMKFKSQFEDIGMKLETMKSAWESTARYLGEDSSASSSEYVFNLLNRFLLDVKVAKTLLFRQGYNFAADVRALFPNAHVGGSVATVFGPGVITALRVAENRIQIKFPWSQEAYLSPSCILSSGSLVKCRMFGVGIIRETHYEKGFCCVRFPFGYGMVRVQDISMESSSNANQLKEKIMQSEFRAGDPVVTPFGCGYIKFVKLHGKYHYKRFLSNQSTEQQDDRRDKDGIAAVDLLSSEQQHEKQGRVCAGVAFVHLRDVELNYWGK